MKIAIILEKAKFAKDKGIYFHGTSSDKLASILKKGLLPKQQGDSGGFGSKIGGSHSTRDMSSIGGVYLTPNFRYARLAATQAAVKNKTKKLIVVVQAEPRSGALDEDDIDNIIEGPVSGILGQLNKAKYPIHSENTMFRLLHTDPSIRQDIIDMSKKAFEKRGADPRSLEGIDDILFDLVESYFGRKLAHLVEQGGYSWRYKDEKELFEQKGMSAAEYEQKYKNALDKISKRMKNLYTKGNISSMMKSFRIDTPIGYRGANKILAIFSIDGDKPVMHYGTIPDSIKSEIDI